MTETKTVPLSAVRTVITTATPFTQYLQLTGTVEADTVASLSSPAEGPVLQLTVREGDAVESGQILLRIGRTSGAEAELVAAEEAWQTQQKEFDRVSRLVDERALAGEQLDRARAALERSRSQLSRARQASQDFTVAAPWNGLVSKLHVSEGRYVAPRMPLVEVFDPSSLLLRFQVPERHAFVITVGQELRASFDAFPGRRLI